ncbi:MAG: metallophosphoesterase family protein [Sporolactobacillus sp.]
MAPEQRLLVISDIHGQIHLLDALLGKVAFTPGSDRLLLLGDYVDRGRDSKAVIQRVRLLQEQGATVLKGNHEDMMEKALIGRAAEDVALWTANGGAQTLASYSVDVKAFCRATVTGETFALPAELTDDLEWIGGLSMTMHTDGCLFVHAGVDPTRPLEAQGPQQFLWMREPFFSGYAGSEPVIVGHTPTINLHDSFDVYFADNQIIAIDGGAVFGGQLNCLELPSKRTWAIKAS